MNGGTIQMKCPFCNQDDTRVVDSRPVDDNSSIRRRRMCDACGKRFTTYEKVETIPLIVIKKDQNREQYDRRKIENGVIRACYKRPISAQQITKVVDQIENQVFGREEREVSSEVIGELVMDQLKDLDAAPIVFEQEYFPEDELIYVDLPYTVEKEDGMYVVEGPKIEKMLGYTNLDSEKGFAFFQKFLKDTGILKELEDAGIEEGDTVRMYGLQFDYHK